MFFTEEEIEGGLSDYLGGDHYELGNDDYDLRKNNGLDLEYLSSTSIHKLKLNDHEVVAVYEALQYLKMPETKRHYNKSGAESAFKKFQLIVSGTNDSFDDIPF